MPVLLLVLLLVLVLVLVLVVVVAACPSAREPAHSWLPVEALAP